MIVSASYNDDIPAFYGRWFMKRLDAGFCRTFDTQGLQLHRVPLTREAVDGFVFWTRNARPFLPHFETLHRRGFPFVVQYAITGESKDSVADAHELARAYGPRAVVWRYAPLVLSAETPLPWHMRNFERLVRAMQGATDEVVVAFDGHRPAATGEIRAAVKQMAALACACAMRLSICSQPDYLVPPTSPARCIDAKRLSDVANRPVAAETHPRWSGCLCAAARDIGAPLEDRSIQGPVLAPRREDHDEDGEFLVPPPPIAAAKGADLPF